MTALSELKDQALELFGQDDLQLILQALHVSLEDKRKALRKAIQAAQKDRVQGRPGALLAFTPQHYQIPQTRALIKKLDSD